MIKAVIFDLDGVLVSTDELHYRAWKALADREGIPFDREINDRLRGVSRMASLDIILEKAPRPYTDGQKQEMAAYKNDLYRRLLQELTPDDALAGGPDVLRALAERDILTAVGSSSKNAKLILEKTALAPLLNAVVDGTDITRSKPDPEVFLRAAEKLGVAPADCAVVEDAESGIRAAKAGGMLAWAVGPARGCGLEDTALSALTDILDLI